MENDISLWWLTLTGMGATVLVYALIIGLIRIMRILLVRRKMDEKEAPLSVIISTALAAMYEDTLARHILIRQEDSAWAAKVREDSARVQGSPRDLEENQ